MSLGALRFQKPCAISSVLSLLPVCRLGCELSAACRPRPLSDHHELSALWNHKLNTSFLL